MDIIQLDNLIDSRDFHLKDCWIDPPITNKNRETLKVEFDPIYNSCLDKMRYGKLWTHFSVNELLEYAKFKLKRGVLLYNGTEETLLNIEKSKDDISDTINILMMVLLKMESD